MATLNSAVPTLIDVAKSMDPDGSTATVAELLAQSNEILMDAPVIEGNLPTGHRVTVRDQLPSSTKRKLNAGVTPSKGSTEQYDEGIASFEQYCETDVDIAMINGNTASFRALQNAGHIEAISQDVATELFYGTGAPAEPEGFKGFANRYNSLSGNIGQQVISGGSVSGSDACSIYLIGWAPDKVSLFYPKGSRVGLHHEDLGKQLIEVDAGVGGGKMMAYVDHWQWKVGLQITDYRYVVRIANIDTSALAAGSGTDLIEKMIVAIHRIPNLSACRPVFYANRTARTWLDVQANDKTNAHFMIGEEEGRPKTLFRGIPIRTTDALTVTEAAVA